MADSNGSDAMADFHASVSKAKTDAHASGDTSGFMANAAAGMRRFIGAGPLGPFIGPAGDESAQRIFGGGPNQT
jgi:hypothetical protein